MPKCIYREVNLNKNFPEDDNTTSIEHIIPWSIGGTNNFIIYDVSKKANNELGSAVDARFADTLPIAIKRHQLQLKSQNGNIPPIVWHGKTSEGHRGSLTINSDGTTVFDLAHSVIRPEKGRSGPTIISGSRERLTPILQGMLEGMRKRHETAYSDDGRLLLSLDDFWSVSKQTQIDSIKLSVEYFDQEAWTRGVVKIALAACHKFLGEEWSFGAQAGILRQIVLNPQDQWPESPRGFIAGEWDRAFRIALGKTAAVRDSCQHIVGVLPRKNGGGVVAISLFGGNGVPEAVIDIGPLPRTIVQGLNQQDNKGVLLGFQVNPNDRSAKPILFGDVDRRIAAQRPTNRRSMEIYRDRSLR